MPISIAAGLKFARRGPRAGATLGVGALICLSVGIRFDFYSRFPLVS